MFDGVKATIKTTTRYLGWKDCGGIFAYGCYQKEDIEKTDYPRQAFALGKELERMVNQNENCNRMVKFKCRRIDSSS